MADPQSLLHQFVETGSEAAFRELVTRYIDLIYATALRRVNGDTQLAQDVTQTVFIDLARKANTLPLDVMLGGWLHRHTGFVASTMMRTEQRRQERERQAVEMNALSNDSDSNWKEIAPILDETIDELEPKDRDAIFLRFFERRQLREVGNALGTSEDAAQKRVNRALEKIRAVLAQRGFTLSLTALGTTLLAQPAVSAPGGLIAAACTKALGVKTVVGWATFSKGAPFSLIRIGLAVAAIIWAILIWPRPSPTPEIIQSKPIETGQSESNRRDAAQVVTSDVGRISLASNVLRLVFVDDDSGNPVRNVAVEFRGFISNQWKRKNLYANQEGICDVPLEEGGFTILELFSRATGFAHARLLWWPERGENLPTHYTLRLVRPVSLGGRVIDSEGQPVAGAKVGFNHQNNPVPKWTPESHEFGWVEVETDVDGRWVVEIIAEEMLPRIYGSAGHSNYVKSPMLYLGQNPEVQKSLRDGSHVFILAKAITLSGIVVDDRGQPVSDARVFVGTVGDGGKLQSPSNRDGTFEIPGCKPGTNLVTAEATGFATRTIESEISTDSEPVRIVLNQGKTMRLRAVTKSGEPVPKATVHLKPSYLGQYVTGQEKVPMTQIEFLRRTDVDGRLVWTNAPDSELFFDLHAPGFMLRDTKIEADGEEHVVILPPTLTIAGTVRSADTGAPIPKFRIVCGWPDPIAPVWSPFERDWPRFEGGKFRHTLEPITAGKTNLGYVLKFEAAGFAPFVSRTIATDEGEATFDVALRPLVSIPVTVLRPDGMPAARSDVGMVSSNSFLQLSQEGFSQVDRKTFKPSGYSLKTDGAGKITLSLEEGVTRIVFAHLDGFADITTDTLLASPTIQLQQWGRVEGIWTAGGQPVVGQKLFLQAPNRSYQIITPKGSSSVETEGQGRFSFTNVPPGLNKLMHVKERRALPLKEVEVHPGETASVLIGD